MKGKVVRLPDEMYNLLKNWGSELNRQTGEDYSLQRVAKKAAKKLEKNIEVKKGEFDWRLF